MWSCLAAASRKQSLGCQQSQIIQRHDDLAAGEKFLEIRAALQRTVAEESRPESND